MAIQKSAPKPENGKGQEQPEDLRFDKVAEEKGLNEESEISASYEKLKALEATIDEKLAKIESFEQKADSISKLQEDLQRAKEIYEKAAEKNASAATKSSSGEETMADIEADTLDDAVSFFAHRERYIILSEMRNGRREAPPLGTISFEPMTRTKRPAKVGKGHETQAVSRFVTSSKKVRDYLMSSPKFGVDFHIKPDSMDSDKIRLIDHISKIMDRLRSTEKNEVLKLARKYQIPIAENIDDLRKDVAEAQAKAEISSYRTSYSASAIKASENIENRE